MDRIFFEDLNLPLPDDNLDAGSGSHAEQTGKIMAGVGRILSAHPPDIVLVQGDTNTVLAGTLAAAKLHIPVGHVEAGLRSFDRRMPEEINRIVADHIADLLFAPTRLARRNLRHEGIDAAKIHVTGNTVVDAVFQNREIARKGTAILHDLGLTPRHYFLVTAHRQENVDVKHHFTGIIAALESLADRYGMPVLFPMHPRAQKMVKEFGIDSARHYRPPAYRVPRFPRTRSTGIAHPHRLRGRPGRGLHPERALRNPAREHGTTRDHRCRCEHARRYRC